MVLVIWVEERITDFTEWDLFRRFFDRRSKSAKSVKPFSICGFANYASQNYCHFVTSFGPTIRHLLRRTLVPLIDSRRFKVIKLCQNGPLQTRQRTLCLPCCYIQ